MNFMLKILAKKTMTGTRKNLGTIILVLRKILSKILDTMTHFIIESRFGRTRSMTSIATRNDGLPYEISWRGKNYSTPPAYQLKKNINLGVFKNPAGEIVSPESSDCWFQLLGLVPPLEEISNDE